MANSHKALLSFFFGFLVLIIANVSMYIHLNKQNDEILYLKNHLIELESYQKADSILNAIHTRHYDDCDRMDGYR